MNFLYWLGLFGHSLLRQNRPSITTNLYWPAHYVLYSDECTHIPGPLRSVRIAHKKAQRRGMSLMHRGICGREVWKMDSVITDVGWRAGSGLYSSISFLFICFRDPLSLSFWVDPLAVTLYRWLLTELAFFNKILTSARNGKPRSKDHIRSIQNLSTSIYRYVLRHFSISHTLLTLRVRWIDGTSILDRRGLWINKRTHIQE